ncbi:MAG: EamA family transporter [Sphingobacteriales bacterium]|nr:EamA family transporter [Sphingobacteriales bacterium]
MFYLLLSVFCSCANIYLFKIFGRRQMDTLPIIALNYFVCIGIAMLLSENTYLLLPRHLFQTSWLPYSVALGCLFISTFQLMAYSTQKNGIALTSVANKLSMIAPILVAIAIYEESGNTIKTTGIVLCMASVALVSISDKKAIHFEQKMPRLLLLVLALSACIEILIDYSQRFKLSESELPLFLMVCFGIAGCIGTTISVWKYRHYLRAMFSKKVLIAGLLLGVPNYGSMYFFMKALQKSNWGSSVIFPLNNIAVVLLSIASGVILFDERLNRLNWIGIGVALIGIVLISIGK